VILERAEALRTALTDAITRDATAFETVMAAFKLPKDSPEEQAARQKTIEAATWNAIQVPLEVAGMAIEVLELAAQAVALGNLNAISDGASGGALAQAALTGAGYNVRINAASLNDPAAAQETLQRLRTLEETADHLEAVIRAELATRGGFTF
jgi:formiminotetrahydrofolate cyclodeaminase